MKKRYCNRCGRDLPLEINTNEHVIYDCWTEIIQNKEVEKQDDFDLCKNCYRQFCKFMRGKIDE